METIRKTVWALFVIVATFTIYWVGPFMLSQCSTEPYYSGPGMILTFAGTVEGVSFDIKEARLDDGKAFPNPGPVHHSDNPLSPGSTQGAAPDRRLLPEWVDFKWQEAPYPGLSHGPKSEAPEAYAEWRAQVDAEARSLPVKSQRVHIRSRVPKEVIDEVTLATRRPVKGYGVEKRLALNFIWTTQGVKLRWRIWHTPKFNIQFYSHDGGDDITPEGTTMIAGYVNGIADSNSILAIGQGPARHPAAPNGDAFSGSPNLMYSGTPLLKSAVIVAYENNELLPEWVDFDWRIFPKTVPRIKGESDTEYESRSQKIFDALPVRNERVLVRARIPQEVQSEIATAARNATPARVASSIISLYFIWTDTGIKLYWRLKRNLSNGDLVIAREGGDPIPE